MLGIGMVYRKQMKLVQSGNKWVLYDDNGKIVVITKVRKIAERMMQNDKSTD